LNLRFSIKNPGAYPGLSLNFDCILAAQQGYPDDKLYFLLTAESFRFQEQFPASLCKRQSELEF
jgi:hypothetical protein